MDKEREGFFFSGFSEKQLDQNVDKVRQDDQVKSGNIFDPKKKKKKSGVILDSQPQ